jgi:large subunit ribosomal protein L19
MTEYGEREISIMHPIVREYESKLLKTAKFDFRPGDTVRVSIRIVEGEKERVQAFEGVCLCRKGGSLGETFTVRRISYGVGMERIFPLHSPRIEDIKVVRRGKVRRAALNYLRELRGKKARITEDILRSRRISKVASEASEAAVAQEPAPEQ